MMLWANQYLVICHLWLDKFELVLEFSDGDEEDGNSIWVKAECYLNLQSCKIPIQKLRGIASQNASKIIEHSDYDYK